MNALATTTTFSLHIGRFESCTPTNTRSLFTYIIHHTSYILHITYPYIHEFEYDTIDSPSREILVKKREREEEGNKICICNKFTN